MHYSLLHLVKYYIRNPKELYSKSKWAIILFFLNLYYKIKLNKKINSIQSAHIYLDTKYWKYLETLPQYKEIKERNNTIRWCWLQWENNAPKLNKSCLKSIRKFIKGKNITIITNKNINDFVKFPDYILKKYKDGIISKTHFSDLLRCELLIKYWWTWMDSTVLVTDYNKDFFDSDFFVFKNNDESIALSSWFITSNKNNPILLTTRDLLYKYREHNDYILHYYLFHLFFTIAIKKYPNIWDNIPSYSNSAPHSMQFEFLKKYNNERFEELKKISSIHKLNHKIERDKIDKNSLFAYIENM